MDKIRLVKHKNGQYSIEGYSIQGRNFLGGWYREWTRVGPYYPPEKLKDAQEKFNKMKEQDKEQRAEEEGLKISKIVDEG